MNQCGCVVAFNDSKPPQRIEGVKIVYCPMHMAAAEMLETLKKLTEMVELAGLANNPQFDDDDPRRGISGRPRWWVSRARTVIAGAEGRKVK